MAHPHALEVERIRLPSVLPLCAASSPDHRGPRAGSRCPGVRPAAGAWFDGCSSKSALDNFFRCPPCSSGLSHQPGDGALLGRDWPAASDAGRMVRCGELLRDIFSGINGKQASRHNAVPTCDSALDELCHGSALEEIGGEDGDFCETIDSHGLATRTLEHLTDCAEEYDFNRVEVLLHMIQSLITHNLDVGVLKVQPPILSRVYQTLSRGFVNLLNAKKIADTRFPFPFAQLISALLFLHIVLLPVLISAVISQAWLAFTFTFLPIFSMCCLNYIGVELENPFGRDDNDLPLKHFQAEMNNCLLMLLHYSADLMAGVSKQRCLMDIMEIRKAMHGTLSESWLQEIIDKAPGSPAEANVKDVEEEESQPNSVQEAGVEVVLPLATQGETSSDGGAAPIFEEPAFEEKLQPTTLLQGMDQAVMALTGIRQAIAMQATDVDRSIDGFLVLAKKLRTQTDDLIADEAEPADVEFTFGWDCSAIPSFEASS
eukprot:CAMPEP_0181431180 /NCGR_PEP_ID=MMETSP1110-20121109/18111_1 /TAXON_ID=174948 /ORGANISM="Symbiodinium sp., Strain CCMP421" /LENGTH=486 /DNA_ID=CAMNT_0023554529 /DNA_START=23 /DNA_END=1484 /DNA_ORIENTATION=+